MTLEKVKKAIIKLKGERISPSQLIDCFENPCEIMESFSPSQWLFNFTEIEMAENFFDSVYRIPIKGNDDGRKRTCTYAKEYLIFLGTEDGINADYLCSIYPPFVAVEENDRIFSIIREGK